MQKDFEDNTNDNIQKEETLPPILRLNDDCIRHVATFLDRLSLTCLTHTHSRFLPLIVPEYVIDPDHMSRLPWTNNGQSYRVICPLVSSVRVEDISKDILKILPLFNNLNEFRFESELIDDQKWKEKPHRWFDCFPSGIRKLTLRGDKLKNLHGWFWRLSPSIKMLHVEASHPFYPIDEDPLFLNELGLDVLSNIEEFICEDLVITSGFGRFLKINQDSLTCLDIHLRWSHNVFSSLTAMRNLKKLRVDIAEEVYRGGVSLHSYKNPNSSALPMLEELEISYTEDPDFADYQYARDGGGGIREFIQALDGSKLRFFHFGTEYLHFDDPIFQRMNSLVELSLKYWWPELIPDISRMAKLHKLTVDPTHSELLNLVKGLPKLAIFDTKSFITESLINEVREYSRQANRKLILNGQLME